MKKTHIILGVAVVGGLVLAFMAFRPGPGSEPVVYTAVSPDGLAQVTIPSSSLPDGVLGDEITVLRVDDPDAAEGSVTYALAPEGLMFDGPVRFQVTLDVADETIPELVHIFGGTFEPLEDVTIVLNPEAGTVEASGGIRHFSEVKVIYPGFFKISIIDPPALEYFLDESFSVTAKVEQVTDTIYYNEKKQSGEKIQGPWPLEGTLKGADETIFNPGRVEDVPRFAEVGTYEVTKTLTCVTEGTTTIDYDIWLRGNADVYYSFNEAARYSVWHSKQVKVSTSAITCKPLVLDTSAGPGTGLQGTSHDPDGLNCPDAKYLSVDLGGFSKEVHKLRDGKCYPKEQFVPESDPDKCEQSHYHVELRSLGRNVRSDSQPCGAATRPDIVASGTIWITSEQISDIIDFDFDRRNQ